MEGVSCNARRRVIDYMELNKVTYTCLDARKTRRMILRKAHTALGIFGGICHVCIVPSQNQFDEKALKNGKHTSHGS